MTTVIVPARDYVIPVERERDYTSTIGVSGLLLLSTGDYLLLSTGDKIILRSGDAVQAPVVSVPYRDYIIPVPERQ